MTETSAAQVGSITGVGLTGLGILIGQLTVTNLVETAVITFVGGMFGLLGAEFIKWARKKVK